MRRTGTAVILTVVLAATLTGGRPAAPVTANGLPAVARCPAAPYGPRFYAPGAGRTVALTFDDGPGRSTAAILAILARNRVPATFFNIGASTRAWPRLVRAEATGPYELGNHTWGHAELARRPARYQAAELDKASAEQIAATGSAPCVFRPPYGDYDATTLRLAQQRRMRVWLWSVDTQDWMARGSAASWWVHRIIWLAETEGGALRHPVVLMHNQLTGNPATVSALPAIISFFRARGYRFVTC